MADVTVLKARVSRWAERVTERSGELLQSALRDAAPLGRTGETRRMVTVQRAGSSPTPGLVARSASPHGDYVEEGTPAHVILPRTAKVLVFPGSGGRVSTASPNQRVPTRAGGVVFATRVDHPGTPPRPWFAPTVRTWPTLLRQAAAAEKA